MEDVDPVRKVERERQLIARMVAVKLERQEGKKGEGREKEFDAMAVFVKLTVSTLRLCAHAPALLRAIRVTAEHDRSSAEYQGHPWDELRKSTTGILTQQGQHGQYQACRPRALLRETHRRP